MLHSCLVFVSMYTSSQIRNWDVCQSSLFSMKGMSCKCSNKGNLACASSFVFCFVCELGQRCYLSLSRLWVYHSRLCCSYLGLLSLLHWNQCSRRHLVVCLSSLTSVDRKYSSYLCPENSRKARILPMDHTGLTSQLECRSGIACWGQEV